MYMPGRHFLQIPGPTNTPLPILAAIARPTIDHRGPEFGAMGVEILERVKRVFKTKQPVIIYPASGTGAWEAALVNTLSAGDEILMFETGWFARLWSKLALRLGLKPEVLAGDWRSPVDCDQIADRLRADRGHKIKAVCVVHNETSTGTLSDIAKVRKSIDAVGHPALLIVDTISSLGSVPYEHDEWGVDVTVAGSQKGLMMPPGLSFNAISQKALAASQQSNLPKAFWGWGEILDANTRGFFPYTPSTNLLQGLNVALDLLEAEGMNQVFARHRRAGEAVRAAVRQWGFATQCQNDAHHSPVLTAVRLPEGHSADDLRATILNTFNMSLGNGLGPLNDCVFRIGHLGDFSDLSVIGSVAAVEMGLHKQGVPHAAGGTDAAMRALS